MNKPTMQQKYESLPEKGRDIVDHVVGSAKQGMERAQSEYARLCAEHKITLGESCALSDLIRHRISAQSCPSL